MDRHVRGGLAGWSNAWLALVAAACVHPEPPPSPSPEPKLPVIAIPDGCERDLSGTYVLNTHPGFRYRASDDGSALTLSLSRGPAGCASIALWRTAHGFVGKSFGGYVSDAGVACAVTFPTELTACTDAGLVLRSPTKATFNGQCAPVELAEPPALTERLLLRTAEERILDAGPADAGESQDGGPTDAGSTDGGLSSLPPPV